MADPIGTSSAVLALAIFAFDAAASLIQTLDNFGNFLDAIATLKKELRDLQQALVFLRETISKNEEGFLFLKPYLSTCLTECGRFQVLVNKYTEHSTPSKTSKRDFMKFKFKENKIVELRDLLSRHKTTILLAIAGVNLDRVTANGKALNEVQRIITKSTAEVQRHLQKVDQQLQALSRREACNSDDDATEWKRLQDEKASIEKQLVIFDQVLALLREAQSNNLDDVLRAQHAYKTVRKALTVPVEKWITTDDIREFQAKLENMVSAMNASVQSIDERLRALPETVVQELSELKRLQNDRQIDQQSLAFYEQLSRKTEEKRVNISNNVLAATNANQIIVSTFGDLVANNNVRAESGATQIMGQMSDTSLQTIIRPQLPTAKVDEQRWLVMIKFWIPAALSALVLLVVR